VPAKAIGLFNRSAHLVAQARSAGFHVAVGHNSNDLALAAWTLGIPQLTMFDYEYATVSHHLNVRLVDEIVVPEAIPLARLEPFGAKPHKVFRYPGLKEEYYLYDFQPDATVLEQLGINTRRIVGVLRPAPHVTLYHRHENPLFDQVVEGLAARRNVTLVITPRTDEQRRHYSSLGLANVVVPEKAVDGLSLIAAADFVVGAGGTMNREAVALGTPAYTMFAGRLGAVDEGLIAEGRLGRASSVDDVVVKKKRRYTVQAERRDPQLFVDEILRVARRRLIGRPSEPVL
jgi:predicted glycosyltransferase